MRWFCHLKKLIFHAIVSTRHLIHGTLKWEKGWSKREGGRDVMFTAAWRELALRESEMISSWADSWDHNSRLPAAAWQIERERQEWYRATSPDSQHSLIPFNYFQLGFRKQLRQRGKTTDCASSQWNTKWTLRCSYSDVLWWDDRLSKKLQQPQRMMRLASSCRVSKFRIQKKIQKI